MRPADETTHELIVSARNEVARGWIQSALSGPASSEGGRNQDPYGVCLIGGFVTRSGVAEIPSGLNAALHVVAEAAGVHRDALVEWNNAPERTKDEVLAALDAAAAATAPEPLDWICAQPTPEAELVLA